MAQAKATAATELPYSYSPINTNGLDFRLVRLRSGLDGDIECEIVHASLDQESLMPYEAVSYTWGPKDKNFSIHVGQTTLAVTGNLYFLLRDLRSRSVDRMLWVDAICINQDDHRERSHQVGQMGSIYATADCVVVCLGRETVASHRLMRFLGMLHDRTRGANWAPGDPRWDLAWLQLTMDQAFDTAALEAELRGDMGGLLAHSWFRRVWILQEVGKAQRAMIYCGSDSVSCRVFIPAVRLLGLNPDEHTQAVLDLMPGPQRAASPWLTGCNLRTLLTKFSSAEATNPRDRIFALLGLCGDNTDALKFIRPDYDKPDADVVCETVSFLLRDDKCCEPAELFPEPSQLVIRGIDAFLAGVDSLHDWVLGNLLSQPDETSRIHWFLNRYKNEIRITRSVVEAAVKNVFLMKRDCHGLDLLSGAQIEEARAALPAMDISDSETLAQLKHWPKEYLQRVRSQLSVPELLDWKSRLSMLEAAIRTGCAELVYHLARGIPVSTVATTSFEPLTLAAVAGMRCVVHVLLAHGADPNYVGKDGRSPMDWAIGGLRREPGGDRDSGSITVVVSTDSLSCIRLLLHYGANVNRTDPLHGTPILQVMRKHLWSESFCHLTQTIRMLLDAGSLVQCRDHSGGSPVDYAVDFRCQDCLGLLLRHGADANGADSPSPAPIIRAMRTHEFSRDCPSQSVQLLLDARAHVHCRDEDGRSPLDIAIKYDCQKCLRLLTASGADGPG